MARLSRSIAGTALALLFAAGELAVGQARPVRVRVSQKVSEAFVAKKVQPQYPLEAREKHIQGLVVLKAEISKDGDVTDLSLVSGDSLLAPAAIEAVKQWKYKPYLLNGQPIAVETQVTVSFELRPK
jgi:TonB family protein